MNITSYLVALAAAGTLAFTTPNTHAQGPPPGGGFGGPGGFDPAQIQDFLLNAYREQLGITDDAEWSVIKERIAKVTEAQRGSTFGGMGRLFAGRGQGRGQGGARGMSALMPEPSPEETALQSALDSGASNEAIKAALARFVEARKQRQAQLEKAQADLRAVLNTRREAIATMLGLL